MDVVNELYLNFISTTKTTSLAQTGDILLPIVIALALISLIAFLVLKKRYKIAGLFVCVLVCFGLWIPASATGSNINVNVDRNSGEFTVDEYQMNLESHGTLNKYKCDILDQSIKDASFEISINDIVLGDASIAVNQTNTLKVKIHNLDADTAKSLIGKSPVKLTFDLTLETQDEEISKDMDLGHGYTQSTYKNSKESDFKIRKAIIEKQGYTIYESTKYNDNQFITFAKGNDMYYLAYTPSNNQIREITCSNACLPPKTTEPYTKVCDETVSIIQIVANDHLGDTLGCVYRLEDGTFIVMDGGGKKEMDTTYECLKKLAVDPNNIRIRMWYFSHPHGDHTGAFQKYVENPNAYPNLKIESFCYNFASNNDAYKYTPGNGRVCKQIDTAVEPYLTNSKFYKPLTGQVFHFPGANIDVLYTYSDFCPTVMGAEDDDPETKSEAEKGKGDGNLESSVIKISSLNSGHTFINTADVGDYNIRQINKRYNSEVLKCDVMTMPHHGHDVDRYRARNGNMEFYKLTDPTAIMIPMTKFNYSERSVAHKDEYYEKHHIVSYTNTEYIIKKCVGHVYLAGEKTYTIRMSDLKEI